MSFIKKRRPDLVGAPFRFLILNGALLFCEHQQIVLQRSRPGGSAGEGIAADFPLLGELAVTCTGAGWGIPAPAFNSRWSLAQAGQ